ncbi:adenosylcobinamide amidohydrolase [Bacillus solimangrovi]|uniref:ABC transporter ATP-binding protein n=1 Tax=Bacillus solimangrovi TaxID=1305675 RepID=A0A1E5LHG3_9BACI|nr:adenosylcobinamide amidohydrolase [Bacillus solimangrovi]OEH93520.1 ABC transporter ATP-binding protein [Bacillus solimangrovi]
MLKVKNASGGYGKKKVVSNISFSVKQGEVFGIIGPNGSGKSTLLQMINGKLPLMKGEILLNEQHISMYTAKEQAKLVAVLSQENDVAFAYTVRETVKLGRYSHQSGLFPRWSYDDEQAVIEALEKTQLTHLQDKSIQLLSGGERQRVYLARALAQKPKLLLLDEPTNHLDIAHQMRLLDTLKDWAKQYKFTVISIFHDLNLASLYCDRLLMLEAGKMVELQPSELALTEEKVQRIYETDVSRVDHPTKPAPFIAFEPKSFEIDRVVSLDDLTVMANHERITITSSKPIKTLSSALIGSGFQWSRQFVNRHVHKDYNESDPLAEMTEYLSNNGIQPQQTIAMMTAARLEDASYKRIDTDEFSLFIVVTAGTGNAVDVSKAYMHKQFSNVPGTINSWIFINACLTEAAFVQAMMTATEAKVKALQSEQIIDSETDTIATGTSTDSVLVGATQTGSTIEYAGTITNLGKAIGKLMYEAVSESVERYKQRVKVHD